MTSLTGWNGQTCLNNKLTIMNKSQWAVSRRDGMYVAYNPAISRTLYVGGFKLEHIRQDIEAIMERQPSGQRDYELVYDVCAFLHIHSYIDMNYLSVKTGINLDLLNCYAAGINTPTPDMIRILGEVINGIVVDISNTNFQLAKDIIELHKQPA